MGALLLLALLVAGCASPEEGAAPPTTTAASLTPTPEATPAATPAAPSPSMDAPTLGVVLDETHDFAAGGQRVSMFNVTGAERRIVIGIESSGPAEGGAFSSAVVSFYYPRSTSPFLGELPSKEARSYTVEQQPHAGEWRIVYDGQGPTTVRIHVTLE